MKSKYLLPLPTLIVVLLGIGSLSKKAGAEEPLFPDFKLFNGDNQKSAASHNLKQSVYTLDTLADQMVFRYGLGMHSRKDDADSVALHAHMKRHAELTNVLVKAVRGTDAEAFGKASEDIRNSVGLLYKLAKTADVGDSVAKLITKSGPIAAWICANPEEFNAGSTFDPGKIFKKPEGSTSA